MAYMAVLRLFNLNFKKDEKGLYCCFDILLKMFQKKTKRAYIAVLRVLKKLFDIQTQFETPKIFTTFETPKIFEIMKPQRFILILEPQSYMIFFNPRILELILKVLLKPQNNLGF